jgi:cell division transport system permease protein
MRLVGASNMFIRLPFIFEGILYGVTATLISMFILFLTLKFSHTNFFTPSAFLLGIADNKQILGYYYQYFGKLFGLEIFIGAVFGVISSWIAMRKYLKI